MHRCVACTVRLGASLATAALLAACGAPQHPFPPPQPPFATLVVNPQQSAREQTWDGVVEAVDATTIAAQTNARVLELPVDVDDHVRKGDVLVRFSDVEQQSGRRAAAPASRPTTPCCARRSMVSSRNVSCTWARQCNRGRQHRNR